MFLGAKTDFINLQDGGIHNAISQRLHDEDIEALVNDPDMREMAAAEKPAGTSTKSAFIQARGQLGAKTNMVVLFDLPNTLAKILDLVVQAQVLPLPLDANQVKDLQSNPSYIGISAGTEPQGLRVRTVVPAAQMQGIAKIVMFFQRTLGGIGQ